MNKKERMYKQIEQHGGHLNAIFKTSLDNITLAKRLKTLENKAHRLSEDYCNGLIESCEEWERQTEIFLKKVDKILDFKKLGDIIFVNGDPRGYALKIYDEVVRVRGLKIYRDWGGYGILAPEFDGS